MLKLLLLGKPAVFSNETLVTDFVSSKVQGLLFYLAVTQQAHSRQALIGLFWGQDSEKKAKSSLRVALANLKRIFPQYIDASRTSIQLAKELPLQLDLHQFEKLTQTKTLLSQQSAAALYRDHFLADFQVDATPAFEEWLLAQRTHWQQLALQLFADLATQQMAQRTYTTAVSTLQRLLSIEPWQESAHRQLMLAYSRQRDFNAALAQYETCRRLLRTELDVTPMAETAALQERILDARQAPPANLPHNETTFFGRIADIIDIRTMLLDKSCRLVTLTGLGGMGKTRLALAVMHTIAQEDSLFFINGVVYVPLQDIRAQVAVTAKDAIALAIVQALGLYLPGRTQTSVELVTYLQSQEILLLLDNFEHLLEAAPWLTQLLAKCPDTKLLVTSREPLNITPEWRFELAGLPFPSLAPSQKTSTLSPATYPAIDLFTQTAQQVQPAFQLTTATRQHAQRICELVSGVPLAIKLAASWLRVMPSEQLVAEAQNSLDMLSTRMRDVPPRQRSMRAIFETTWESLSAVEQKTLAALSVFRGGFMENAARQICHASPLTLAELKDRSLLQFDPDTRRNSLHELVRQFAAEKLANSPTTAVSIRTTHAHYFGQQLAALNSQLYGQNPHPSYATIRQEIGNVREAWQHAIDHLDLATLEQLVEPLAIFYVRQGWFAEGQERMAAAVTALQQSKHQGKTTVQLLGNLLARQGSLAGRTGQFATGEALLRQSIQNGRQAADPHLLSYGLIELGGLLRDQSRFAEAKVAFDESFDIATELNEQTLIALAIEKQGVVAWDLGDHGVAELKQTEALAHFRTLGDTMRIGITLNSLGNVTMSAGHYQTALAHFQEALPIARLLEDWLFLDTVLINLGMVSNNLEAYEQSRRYYEESLEICRRIGDEIGIAYCLTGIGQAYMEAGDLGQAERLFEQSLARNSEMGRERYVAINLNYLGDLAQKKGDLDKADAYFSESLEISQLISHPWGVASSKVRLGDLNKIQGQSATASTYYLDALKLAEEMETTGFVLSTLVQLAGIMLEQEATVTAVSILHIVKQHPSAQPSLQRDIDGLLQTADLPAPAQIGELAAAIQAVRHYFEN